jgi:splicing factor 3B subunit 3
METFGKSGIRRTIPGEYLACDPTGRAIMIASIERSKFVYILNRTTEKILISSPLEAHKNNTVCSSIVSLDVGFENPQFCSLEVDFEDSDTDPSSKKYNEIEKFCVIWELDLGLNHVVKKKNIKVDRSAYLLIALPASPGGVLCFSEGLVTWVHEDYPLVSVNIPRRKDPLSLYERKDIIVSAVVHKLKKDFFVLMQTDLGDVFKLTLDYIPGVMDGVKNIKVKYFETLSVSVGLCLLKSGFLFSASEFGNHQLFQVENLGDDDDEQPTFDCESLEGWFTPRGLRNLGLVDEIESMSPLLDACVANLTEEDTPQIYAICGKGSRSTFRILRHGLQVSEIAESELPGIPNAVWTVKTSNDDQYDSMIIISFVNATLCLSIGESVEEVSDTGILVTSPTLCVGQLGDDALVQIYPGGIRHIRSDRRVSEWKAPEGTHIVQGASNFRQVCVALSNTELVYFELDYSGNLNEFQERKELGSQVCSIALSPIPEGRQRALFLSLGCDDNTVRVLSLDPNNCLQSVSMQALSAPAESLALIEMVDPITSVISLYLNMGLTNGVFLRTTIDNITGLLTDVRQRFLGTKAVKLVSLKIGGGSAVMALSTQPWLSFTHLSRTKLIPLSYEQLEHGSSFCSEQCPEGIVAISGNVLKILNVEKLGSVFNQVSIKLKYTPRRLLLDEISKNFIILESENGVYSEKEKQQILNKKVYKN